MKRLLLSSLVALSAIGTTPALAANSVYHFDEKRAEFNPTHRTITEAVIFGDIVEDVARVQTAFVDGIRKPVFIKAERNMTALETHCQKRQVADKEDASLCLMNYVGARAFLTAVGM